MSDVKKNILHITNDYSGSKVYKQLVQHLDNYGLSQIIYTPIRDDDLIGSNQINFQVDESKIIYSYILNKHIDRLIYPLKIIKIFRDIEKKVKIENIDLIHAHTWYSDGGVALLLSLKYRIPFILTIRNSDINFFHRKLAYLRSFGKLIISKAEHVVVISASYKKRVLALKSLQEIIKNNKLKLTVIPNGVDKFWLKNSNFEISKKPLDSVNILYVGRFDNNKNIIPLMYSVIEAQKTNQKRLHLNIVGKGGGLEKKVINLVNEYPNHFTYHGPIHDKSKLLEIFRGNDLFAMPSQFETFGLVYIEALLQGLPILYTQDEGIDGYYPETIGEKVNDHTVPSITDSLLKMINHLDSYDIPLEEIKENHDWNLIASKYLDLYISSIKSYCNK